MTIHLHWYCIPIGIIILGIVAGFVCDSSLRGSSSGTGGYGNMLDGCLGISIIFLFLAIAIGVTIGHYV